MISNSSGKENLVVLSKVLMIFGVPIMLASLVGAVIVTEGCMKLARQTEVQKTDRVLRPARPPEDPVAVKANTARIANLANREKDPFIATFLQDCTKLVQSGVPTLKGATYRNASFHSVLVADAKPMPDRPVWVYPDGTASLTGLGFVCPASFGKTVPLPDPPEKSNGSFFGRRAGRDWVIDQFVLVLAGREKFLDRAAIARKGLPLGAAVLNSLKEQVMLRRQDGDDAAAIADGSLYLQIKKALGNLDDGDRRTLDFPFSPDIEQLISDSQRRLEHPRLEKADPDAWAKLPTQERIAKLIDGLDELNMFGVSNPGGVMPSMNSYMQKVVDVGDEAVDPLLDCAQNDRRLTRFCWETGHVMDEPLLVYPVRSVALAAAAQIVGINQYRSVEDVRTYWAKVRKHSGLERLVATLQDPSDQPSNWISAMGRICARPLVGGKPGPMKGEALHSMTRPSLSEIVAERVKQLTGSNAPRGASYAAVSLAKSLARWDPSSALPSLRLACGDPTAFQLGTVYAWRIRLGDKDAVQEYLKWYRDGENGRSFREMEVEPFNAFPNDPELSKAAPDVFEKLNKGKGPERWPGAGSLMVPCVYERVHQFFNDRSVIGSVRRDGAYCVSKTDLSGFEIVPGAKLSASNRRSMPRFTSYIPGSPGKGSDWIRDGSSSDVLACDGIAKTIAQRTGKPFCYGWKRERRDQAVAEARKWLEANKGKFDQLNPYFDFNFL